MKLKRLLSRRSIPEWAVAEALDEDLTSDEAVYARVKMLGAFHDTWSVSKRGSANYAHLTTAVAQADKDWEDAGVTGGGMCLMASVLQTFELTFKDKSPCGVTTILQWNPDDFSSFLHSVNEALLTELGKALEKRSKG